MARISCCKDCPDRYLGCHGFCEKYKEEKKAMAIDSHGLLIEKEIDAVLTKTHGHRMRTKRRN